MKNEKKKRIYELFAICPPGLEAVCAKELLALGLIPGERSRGGLAFAGGLDAIYRANLWLRSASRVLVRLSDWPCRDFPELYRKALKLPWGSFLRPGRALDFRVSAAHSRLWHSDRIALSLREAIERSLGPAPASSEFEPQQVFVRFSDDRCQISLDSSGELLHRRGYRKDVRQAPLRETLAAGVLQLLGWDGSQGLVDPMCGSGTFLSEALLLAQNRPPGRDRDFAFMHWPGYRQGLWNDLCRSADGALRPRPATLPAGYDLDPEAIAAARRNLERLEGGESVHLELLDIRDQKPHAPPGLVICNPPYGERLGDPEQIRGLYGELGACYRRAFSGWRGAFVAPSRELAAATGLNFQETARLVNGGIPVGLYSGRL